MVVATDPPLESRPTTVFFGRGMDKTRFEPHLVIDEVSHPLSAPIAVPATAYTIKEIATTMGETGNTRI
jgi:serine protease inhibitor ecotin